MDHYITGTTVKKLREQKKMTQMELAEKLGVSDKTISKWETAKGLPDITMLEPLAKALGISIVELVTGDYVTNRNEAGNMLRSHIYICPICGNVIHTIGEAVISCCGISLPVVEAEEENESHKICCENVEDEYYITMNHEMTKEHYISFFAYVTADRFNIVKLYAEGNPEARFLKRGHGIVYAYCNKHGLIKERV